MKNLLILLFCFFLLLGAFFSIVNSEFYYYAYMDTLPLGFVIIFILWPLGILNVIASIITGYKYYKLRKTGLLVTSISIFLLSIIIGIFGLEIYENVMVKYVNLMKTTSIFDSNSKAVKHFSKKVLNKRQEELIVILEKKGDFLPDKELAEILNPLRYSRNPIVSKYIVKLFKMRLQKNKSYTNYAFYIKFILDNSKEENPVEFQEIKNYIRETLKDPQLFEKVNKSINFWVQAEK
ncbi:MAG: hypothetical protein ABIH71_00820 [Candidatus Omnitrophota bacterium]